MSEQPSQWRNRIIAFGTKRADQFQAHPRNWRTHPQVQRDALADSLNTVGWVGPVIENARTGHVLDGHERIWQALERNEEVPFVQVDVSEDEELLVLATFDPLTQMAVPDAAMLADILADLEASDLYDDPQVAHLLDSVTAEVEGLSGEGGAGETEEPYSRKIEAPHYTPSGDKPDLSELFDDRKTRALVAEIEANSDLSEGEKRFLILAAQRHTVLNFSKIADYYAHSPEAVQTLMENSALVVIDFKRAIELGYVQLTGRIADLVRDEYGD